jgi:hypothetical protein
MEHGAVMEWAWCGMRARHWMGELHGARWSAQRRRRMTEHKEWKILLGERWEDTKRK